MCVVESDIESGAPAPPAVLSEGRTPMVGAGEILTMGPDRLRAHLEVLLSQGLSSRHFDELAEDGSCRIPSLVAVWLISRIGGEVGKPQLVDLSRVDRKEDINSTAGVARLLGPVLEELRRAAVVA